METVVFKPKQFGTISEWYPDSSLRDTDAGALYVSRFLNPGDAFRSLLQFDLTVLPVGKTFKTAYLQLYIYRNEIPSGTINARVFSINQAWNEDSVSWAGQPQISGIPYESFLVPSGWKGFILIDLSSLVSCWLNGDMGNHGCMIIGEEDHNCLVAFASTEYSETDKHPRLILIPEGQGK